MERRVPGWFEHCSNPLHLLRRGCWCNDLLQGSPLCWNSLFFERILTCFALQDANELLLNPIERMIEKMETIKDNPLAAGKPTNRKPRTFFVFELQTFKRPLRRCVWEISNSAERRWRRHTAKDYSPLLLFKASVWSVLYGLHIPLMKLV